MLMTEKLFGTYHVVIRSIHLARFGLIHSVMSNAVDSEDLGLLERPGCYLLRKLFVARLLTSGKRIK